MFDNLGKKIQTFLLVFIIVLLSLIMAVIGFGTPGSEGCAAGSPTYAAEVYGQTITEGSFRAAYNAPGFNRYPTERARVSRLRECTLDRLIERELLLREADRLGLTADRDEVIQRAWRDEIVLLGGPVDPPPTCPVGQIRQNFRDSDGNLSRERFEAFVRNYLRRSIEEFVDWQVAETRADRVREMVTSTVTVSPREVWDAYVQETDRAQLEYVLFDPVYFRDRVEITDQAVRAWMENNEEAVDAEYRRQRHQYTNLEEQARVREILIEVGRNATDDERAAARARAEDLLSQIQGGADFAALARQHSDDEAHAARGGELEWFPRGRHPGMDEAAFDTEPGNVVDHVIENPQGFHVVEVLGHRSGDVPEDEAKRELSEDLYRSARASELAREEADRALAHLRDGNSMEDLDERLLHGWDEAPSAEEATEEAPTEEEATEEPAEEPDPPTRGPRAPQRRETLSFGRSERAIPGPFDSGPLTQAAFEMTMDEPLGEEPMQLGEAWVVYRLVERSTADEEGFDEANQERLRGRLVAQKRQEVLSAYVGRLRARAEAEGTIRINPAILLYGDEESEEGEEPAESESGS